MASVSDEIYKKFMAKLDAEQEKYGRGFNNFVSLEASLSTGYVSGLMNRKQGASYETVVKICKVFGWDINELFMNIAEATHKKSGAEKCPQCQKIQEQYNKLEANYNRVETWYDKMEQENERLKKKIAGLEDQLQHAETDSKNSKTA